MANFTETTTLDEVSIDVINKTARVVWRDHLFKDGVEVDSARVAREKTYTADMKDAFTADLGDEAAKYVDLF